MNYTIKLQKTKSKFRKILIALISILLLLGIGFGSGLYFAKKNEAVAKIAEKEVVYLGKVLGKYSEPKEGQLAQDVDFKLFWELWDIVKDQYAQPGKLNDKKMFYGAMRGLAASIGDPYTVFMEPQIAQDFEKSLNADAEFEGIGAEIGMKHGIITVVAPLDGMPAEIAGLKAGDKILEIDGETTMGLTVYEAVDKIRGEKGTQVILTIARNGAKKARDITITRGKIIVKSLRTILRDDNIFVIKISNFQNDTKQLMDEAIAEILKNKPKGIILDLRNNPGGYLDISVEISSEWVEDGVIVSEEFNQERKNEFLARGRARLKDYKTAVLVNEGSASASEIVAGALRDYGKATIIGTRTFGKGSVQALQDLRDGSSIKITVANWFTPNGLNINEEGIEPDEIIEMTPEDFENGDDLQMERAVEIITNEELLITN